MQNHRSTKIVATLGPATSSAAVIEQLFLRGAHIFRLNFSHGTHDDHGRNIQIIRDLEEKYGVPLAIMADLQGPKLRIGIFEQGSISLNEGQMFRLDLDARPGDETRVRLPHEAVFAALEVGETILLDDGRVRLIVVECGLDYADCRALCGGILSDRKGVNVPGLMLPISALTAKDRVDLAYALDHNVDWIALSFVQRPDDMRQARALIGDRARLLAKLEKPMAIQHLDDIISLSDAIMVARGDLGVEMPPEEVPCIQKRIIRACRSQGKPVIVATQMLDSMVSSPSPTRAEASDVASAVYDGVDGVMLSAESATGSYPVESVDMMDRIIRQVEKDPLYWGMVDAAIPAQITTVSDAITHAASDVARSIGAAAIVTLTRSGATAYRASMVRPRCPLISVTPNTHVARQLNMVWGCHPYVMGDLSSFVTALQDVSALLKREKFASDKDTVVLTAGPYFAGGEQTFQTGKTRVLRVLTMGEEIIV